MYTSMLLEQHAVDTGVCELDVLRLITSLSQSNNARVFTHEHPMLTQTVFNM